MNMQVAVLGKQTLSGFSRPIVHVQEVNTGYECRPKCPGSSEEQPELRICCRFGVEPDHALLAGAQMNVEWTQ